jgi:cobyrinic acid a,c-diamide synthase
MRLSAPRVVIAGLSGDSGKTLVTLGLARCLSRRGLVVRPFKKGPDYIDAAWLAAAAGRPCGNLDTFMMPEEAIGASVERAAGADLLLVEGNRGLFDGVDPRGTHSTAELARRLGAPVVLVVGVAKTTRTAAALVLGCRHADPELQLAGVILNRVATERHERVVREAVEELAGIPVLGAVPRLGGGDPLPGRHLGLVTVSEHPRRDEAIETAAGAVEGHVDLDRLLGVARSAAPVEIPAREWPCSEGPRVQVGVFADQAFSFYYPENLDALRRLGAEVVEVSPLADEALPEVDALYLGGGFPEVHVARLAENTSLAREVRRRVEGGLPVYAECGGLMYLARQLVVDGVVYPMAGVLDLVVEQTRSPQGHGYEVARVDAANPFFSRDATLVGHEFHYSRVVEGSHRSATVAAVERGRGTGEGRDGIVVGRVWASYLHLHALGTPAWADGLMALARRHAEERRGARVRWA